MKFELEPNNRNCPNDVLLDDLRAVAKQLGKGTLTKDEYNKYGRFSAATMQKRFGSWNSALLQSSLSVSKRVNISSQELIDDLKKVAEKLGARIITQSSYGRLGSFSIDTVSRHFGSWIDALAAAGLESSPSRHLKINDDELFDNLASVWESLGRQPKQSDMHPPISRYSPDTYKRRFGSWRKTLERFVDIDTNEVESIRTKEPNLVANEHVISSSQYKHRTQRDPSWRLRFLVMRRDRFTCCICGRSPANEVGIVLHVDHIHPWSKGGETTLNNLQTLCEKCNLGKSDLLMHENGIEPSRAQTND